MTPDGPTAEVADVDPESQSELDRQERSSSEAGPEPGPRRITGRTTLPAPASVDASVQPTPGLSVRLEQLRAFYGSTEQVKGIDLEFRANEVTAIIGPSGCGKSTMVRCINRMHEEIPGARAEGRVLLEGRDIYDSGVDVIAVRRAIGMVFQKPNPFPTMSIFDNVAAGLRLTRRRGDLKAKVEAALRSAGLWNEVADRLGEPGAGLSGGQQQRLCIARSLAVQPQILLMDEPCSALDPTSTNRIEETIREKLPEGFQRAEYLLEHGIIDMVVPRASLKATLARVIGLLTHRLPDSADAPAPPPALPAPGGVPGGVAGAP